MKKTSGIFSHFRKSKRRRASFWFSAFRKDTRRLSRRGRVLDWRRDMPRRLPGSHGLVFHVMNRGARRLKLFELPGDYQAFLACISRALDKVPIDLFAYCIMPNHFHLVVRPSKDGELGRFMRHLTGTHGKRWHGYRGTVGTGCVYQGRYKAIAVQQDDHFLTVCRYVERNPVRAGLTRRAEAWPWSSAGQRFRNCNTPPLDPWPILQPSAWLELLNEPEPAIELDVIRASIARNRPFGSVRWQQGVPAPGPRGRPARKKTSGVFLRKT